MNFLTVDYPSKANMFPCGEHKYCLRRWNIRLTHVAKNNSILPKIHMKRGRMCVFKFYLDEQQYLMSYLNQNINLQNVASTIST